MSKINIEPAVTVLVLTVCRSICSMATGGRNQLLF